jgi:hypothetical protein
MHSLLDVINYFHHIKDYCEDISPIVIANHRNELVGFIKTKKISSQACYWWASPTLFFRKHLLYKILILKYTMHIIHSYRRKIFYNICMAIINLFRYNSWHVGNQCLTPDNIKLSLESLTSFSYCYPESPLTPSTYADLLLPCSLIRTF